MKLPWRQIWPPLAALTLFIALWQASTALFQIEGWILPPPSTIAQQLLKGEGGLWTHVAATLQLTLEGFLIGTLVGLVIALMLHLIPFLKSALYPLLILSQNIPTIALAPLLMIWFGFGLLPKLIVITLVCFFPVAVATMSGLAETDRVMLNYMRMTGASSRQIFTKLELPHALPAMFSGVKIAATYSVMGAVIAEWIGAERGIGYYMMLQKAGYRTDRMFAAILIIVGLSLIMFAIIAGIEKWLVRWKPRSEQ